MRGDYALVNGRDYRLPLLDASFGARTVPERALSLAQADTSRRAGRVTASSVSTHRTPHARYGIASPKVWASAPPSVGPVRAPAAHAEFITPKPIAWASPAPSARSATSAIPGRVEATEADRRGHHERGDEQRFRRECDHHGDHDRRREEDTNRQESSVHVRETTDERVDGDLDEARRDEDGRDRERAIAGAVEPKRDEHVEGAEEERGEGVEPEPTDERPVAERSGDRARSLHLASGWPSSGHDRREADSDEEIPANAGRMPTSSAMPPKSGPTTKPKTASPNTVPSAWPRRSAARSPRPTRARQPTWLRSRSPGRSARHRERPLLRRARSRGLRARAQRARRGHLASARSGRRGALRESRRGARRPRRRRAGALPRASSGRSRRRSSGGAG